VLCAHEQADGGDRPQRGCRGQSENGPAVTENRPGAEEAHAGDNLAGDARGVAAAFLGDEFTQVHVHRRAQTDEGISFQPGRLVAYSPLQSHHPATQRGQECRE